MASSPTRSHSDLLKKIPESTREELKNIIETVRKERELYTTFVYNSLARAISKRLRELGSPVDM